MVDTQNNHYKKVHYWLKMQYGRAAEHPCTTSENHRTRKEWANMDGIYEKDIEHFTVLCGSCHHKLDARQFIPGRFIPRKKEIYKKRKPAARTDSRKHKISKVYVLKPIQKMPEELYSFKHLLRSYNKERNKVKIFPNSHPLQFYLRELAK